MDLHPFGTEEFEKNILDRVTQLRDLTQGHANDNVTFPILSCIVLLG